MFRVGAFWVRVDLPCRLFDPLVYLATDFCARATTSMTSREKHHSFFTLDSRFRACGRKYDRRQIDWRRCRGCLASRRAWAQVQLIRRLAVVGRLERLPVSRVGHVGDAKDPNVVAAVGRVRHYATVDSAHYLHFYCHRTTSVVELLREQ